MALNVLNFANPIRVGSLASDPSSPVNGLIYYNTTSGKFRKYEGGSWSDMAASAEVSDSTFRIVDNSDSSKKIAFEASGITTSTTRTVTMPDADVNLGHIANLQTLSGVSAGATNLGSFTGAIISDNDTIKGALQDLESAIEALPNPMEYKGSYNASTNSPSLADGVGDVGDVYHVSVAGSQDFGSGSISFAVGDKVVYNGSIWEKWDLTDAVTSVNGQSGAVSLDSDDIDEGSSNLYFTDARARTAVITQVITNGVTDRAPSEDAVFDALAGKSDTGHTHVAADITDFDSAAKAAAVADEINDSVTDVAPSQNAVYDALALKLANVVEDTTPQLGGDLDLNSKAILGLLKRAALASPSDFIEEQYLHAITLNESTTAVASELTFAHASYEGLEVTYKIKEATTGAVRIGTLRIATDGTDTSFTDQYTETADVGVTWSVAIDGTDVEVSYTTTAEDKTMRADVKRIKA